MTQRRRDPKCSKVGTVPGRLVDGGGRQQKKTRVSTINHPLDKWIVAFIGEPERETTGQIY